MPNIKKIEGVKILTDKIKKAKSIVLMDYRGVTASEENKLRKIVNSEEDTEYFVAKNRLFKIALNNSEIGIDDFVLKGPTSFLVSYKDSISGPKVYKEFMKMEDLFKAKYGILDHELVDANRVVELAQLPSKEVLIAMFINQLKLPIGKLQIILKSLALTKEKESS